MANMFFFTYFILFFPKVYSSLTVILLAQTDHLAPELVMVYFTISMMSLSCHMKTSFTDPGTIPESAVPVESMNNDQMCHPMCR